MDPVVAAALFAAAFAAGAINAVAGGGSLVSFPALLAAGLPAIQANVTNTVALWPGYLSGSVNYRHELGPQRRRLRSLVPPSILGALVGSWILLATPEAVFDLVVPLLILAACALMAFQDRLNVALGRLRPQRGEAEGRASLGLWAATFLMGIYGAYFGAALGIMLLAVLGLLLPDDIQRSNALKGMLSLVMNAVAVLYFALWGPVAWAPAAVMAVGAVLGGWVGVGLARRLGRVWLRRAVILYGLFVAAVLMFRLVSAR